MASHYAALQVARDCSADDLRRAYHRLVRRHHPDKQHGVGEASNGSVDAENENENDNDDHEFHRVQHAYEVLRDPAQRASYDRQLKQDELLQTRDVEHVRVADTVDVDDMRRQEMEDDDDVVVFYSHACRCGDVYEISEDELHDGVDVVPCNGCSLNIRVMLTQEQ